MIKCGDRLEYGRKIKISYKHTFDVINADNQSWSEIITWIVRSTDPLSFREMIISAFPADAEESKKFTPKDALLRTLQSADISFPALSLKVSKIVAGADM